MKPASSIAGRIVVSIFLMFWLTGWGFGILIATGQLLDELDAGFGGGAMFFILWVSVAVVAWLFAFWFLLLNIFGRSGPRDRGS